ncbi:unnamed protein product [Bursaphelenchus okinawaensis]|uniref:Phosphatidate cytidylyltransferase, mitochondrial n=1 Tax=Bursaphelenchus okinawaensis TaxID=465554 RepID=A0A811JUQ4_9BILA|nr:unnamed protein product [Bursaphelenchus okinawaensis]CAG9084127.1 unnamed protein product [Bursaphelenchus okinawaensis]
MAERRQVDPDELLELIECLPLEFVEYAFAYGSGAIQQQDEKKEDKMVDFIIVTKDTQHFHELNLDRNRPHYSSIGFLGASKLCSYQRYFAARLFYNTRVKSCGRMIKYGVIDTEDLKEDLLEWRWLYAAGRLHKPVLDVISPLKSLQKALDENRRSALQIALLQLDESFTLTELLRTITAISYNGDFRMKFGEDRSKINKLVDGAFEEFCEIYLPLLQADPRVQCKKEGFEHDLSTPAIYHRLQLLPFNVLKKLSAHYYAGRDPRRRDLEEMVFSIAHRHDVCEHAAYVTSQIVARSAIRQTLKNATTAGFRKGFLYSMDKVGKMVKSLR